MNQVNASGEAARARFGTFAGVFTPNVLTILGIILFLRTGWVVGQAGLIGALIIVLIANSITFLTGLSLSAIATSMNVRAGGNYYLISRTLGLEIGGAIGIPFYLSQAISVAFYIIGFTEALQFLPFFQEFDPRIIATVVAIIFTVIAWVGADIALKIQFFILAILVAALLSFFLGGLGFPVQPTLAPSFSEGADFWLVFAVFFPAVTGIAVGTSMSGDLKDPGRSIPVGTMASIVVTAIVYLAAVIWLATNATVEELINNTFIISDIAVVPSLILFGIWAATLSSALGSIMAAPRTLEAISNDRVIPAWFMNRLGSETEPRLAVLFSAAIAFGIIWAGDLNFVAPIITMFFLNTYGMTNLMAGIEKLVGNPSFRPRFRIHWSLSILGAIGCYATMFLINVPATFVAIVVSFGIYFALQRRALSRTWGDVRNGIWFSLARRSLLNLERMSYSPRNWRPNILVFTGQPHNREALVQTAAWLGYGRGIVSFFQLLVGDVNQLAGHGLQRTARRQIRHYIRDHNMAAFAEADIVPDFFGGALTVAQSHGVGGFEPNSVLMGFSRTAEGQARQLLLLDSLLTLRKSVLLLHCDDERGFGRRGVIDVWWRGRSRNADLMLMLAHIITRHPDWKDAKIRLLRVIRNEEGRTQTERHLRQLLDRVRVEAQPIVLVAPNGQDISVTISEQSVHTDLTLLGINRVNAAAAPAYADRLNGMLCTIGTVMLVHSADEEELLDSGA